MIRLRVLGPITPVLQVAARLGVTDFLSREPSLEETFLAQYGSRSAGDRGRGSAVDRCKAGVK